ncbi:hypothetical protein POM88_023017 [Heracleum sosnowskyi]|uniref:Uncharacterized protein n=1 Tax=Heracleum sosnowskyi TaxID=360622 RepID=A0AAD8IG62_9APIA|nr:hypothetical protein POM88_023017 [Heracleum sosnowskyi]
MRHAASEGRLPDSDEFGNFTESAGFRKFWELFGIHQVKRSNVTKKLRLQCILSKRKTAYYSKFAIGDIVDKLTTLNKDVLGVPAVLERKRLCLIQPNFGRRQRFKYFWWA